jgi:hypothetical protein
LKFHQITLQVLFTAGPVHPRVVSQSDSFRSWRSRRGFVAKKSVRDMCLADQPAV